MLDILIYLFENYMGAQDDWSEEGDAPAADAEPTVPKPDRDTLRVELEQAGFAGRDIDQAFVWVESLNRSPLTQVNARPAASAIRVFSSEECARLDIDCRGYILRLELLGILSPVQREWVIDRLLALAQSSRTPEDIDIEQVKWVVLMVLFSQPDQAAAYAQMEDLVFEEQADHEIH